MALGAWLRRQKDNKKLSKERKKKLLELGVRFDKPADPWDTRFALAKAYYAEHGNLRVPAAYKVNGVNLNKWISEQRQVYWGNREGKTLTNLQIEQLNAIGMTWERRKSARE